MITLFDHEYAVERYGDEREAKGEARGALKHAKETALSMKEKGLSESFIADVLKVSPRTVQQWLAGAPDEPLCQ